MTPSKRKKNLPVEPSDPETSEAVEEDAIGGEDDVEEREIEEMEKEAEDLEEKLRDLRRSVPERYVAALSASLLVQRPVLPSETLGFGRKNDGVCSSYGGTAEIREADQEILYKLNLIKTKPISALEKMPMVLERVNACIERMERVKRMETENIHPVFKKIRKF